MENTKLKKTRKLDIKDNNYFWNKKIVVSYFLSVLIFWIHCSSFTHYIPLPVEIDIIRHFLQHVINLAAVPLFFILSGATFYRDYNSSVYQKKVTRRLKTLVFPYLLWNILNMIFMAVVSYSPFSRYFLRREKFIFSFSNVIEGIFLYKYNGPFWFVFALIMFNLAAPLLYYLIKNKSMGIIVVLLLSILAYFDIGLPDMFFINKTAICYYLFGGWIGVHYFEQFMKPANCKEIICGIVGSVVACLYGFAIQYNAIKKTPIMDVLLLSCFAVSFWKIFDCVGGKIKIYGFMKHSFWVYAMHINVSAVITKLLFLCMPKKAIFSIINFVITTFATLLIIEIIAVFMKRYVPKLYNLLSGGR